MREVGSRIKQLEGDLRNVVGEYDALLLDVPNIPEEDVPVGDDDAHNIVVKTVGSPPDLPFDPKPHWELGESLDIIDFRRAVKLSGSRFYIFKGKGATLQRALITWLLDVLTSTSSGCRSSTFPIWSRDRRPPVAASCRSSPTRCTTMKRMIFG